jgi:acyl-CoA synthetase (AMP-forming)/AMP-acid ligase II
MARQWAGTGWQYRSRVGRATIGDQLRRHARTQPDKIAVVAYAPARSEVTYGELDRLANRYAHLLQARGVGRGDVVSAMGRNSVAMIAAYYGALKVGAAFSAVNFLLGAREIGEQLAHAEPAVVLADAEFGDRLGEAGADPVVLGPDLLAGLPDTEPDADVD